MGLWSAAPMTSEESVDTKTEADFDENHPREAWIPHVAPYVGWIFLMGLLGDPEGWKYAVRTVLCLALLIYCRPWRWYPRLNMRNVPAAVGLGVFVFAFWVLGETAWVGALSERGQSIYLTFFTQDIGGVFKWGGAKLCAAIGYMPDFLASVPAEFPWSVKEFVEPVDRVYAPDNCGWFFTIMRIAGSAFVISIIEEFFWRGYVYRSVIGMNFLKVDMGVLVWKPFLIVCLFFGFMHLRWAAGLLCAIVYGLFAIRTKDVWAAGIAHVVTNFLLGVYVILFDEYQFWS